MDCQSATFLLVLQLKFGQFDIQASEIFTESALSFAFVNLKPVVPGHLLVSPKRVVPRFCDLEREEVADLWYALQGANSSVYLACNAGLSLCMHCRILAQRVGSAAEAHFKANSLTLAIQVVCPALW